MHLEVETLASNRRWATELCRRIAELNASLKHPIAFGANLRITPNANLEELLDSCKQANFELINIGLESGSEQGLLTLHKQTTVGQNLRRWTP
jgi:radical SAM superfamily enzyme YgiQ (UPF0313 family)